MPRSDWRLSLKRPLNGPIDVFILHCGKNLIHVVVVSVPDEGSQIFVSGIRTDALGDLRLAKIEAGRFVLHQAEKNLE